ncbi:MAG TPA: LysR family transcriptional regulator [Aliidongia sp.]|nr:LysR family transcriptional regulator [Aliidongia sp.]
MELNEIRYFLALSETLNFTSAAKLCRVSQPALTRAIRKMEDELGGLLFSRERNNTHITDLGRLILPHLSEVMTRTGEAEQAATRFLRLEAAHLSVGVMCTIAPVRFASFLGRFKADNPGVEVTLLEAVPDRLCELLVKGELDVALIARPGGFQAPFKPSKLYSERFVVACSPGHRFARRKEIAMAEMDGETCFSRINCEFVDVLGERCREQGVDLVQSYRSEREDWILTMVAAGLGVCFLPEFTASFPGVIGCPLVSPAVDRDVCMVTVAGRHSSPPVESFVESVQRYFGSSNQAANGAA